MTMTMRRVEPSRGVRKGGRGMWRHETMVGSTLDSYSPGEY